MTYSAISDAELGVNKPGTSSLMFRLRDNPLSIFSSLGFGTGAKVFTSAETAIVVNTASTFPHGLAQQPLIVQPWLVCITAEQGYAIGDRVMVPQLHNTTGGQGYGFAVFLDDATNVKVHMGTGRPGIYRRDTGAFGIVTAANWKFYIRAWG